MGIGLGSHTTVHAGLAYGGSQNDGLIFKINIQQSNTVGYPVINFKKDNPKDIQKVFNSLILGKQKV